MLGKPIGWLLTRGKIPELLLAIAQRTPDEPIMSAVTPGAVYMERYWLFNKITDHKRKWSFIPFSIRIHVIREADNDRHFHDHPFDAWTWPLRNGYDEVRLEPQFPDYQHLPVAEYWDDMEGMVAVRRHVPPGQRVKLGYDRYHRITALPYGPALTFFAFGDYKGVWGFLVNGMKMPHKEYRETHK